MGFVELHVLLNEHGRGEREAHHQCEYDVEQEQYEEFAVGVAHTIADPRTVMIHVQHASLACRAVVTSKLVL